MKISVALCTYNGEKYIKEQLDSILNQTILPDEIVIFDDYSTDNTYEILKKIIFKPQIQIKLNQNKENINFIRNFEKAIINCSGDIILLSDQDDIWIENKIEKVIDYFNKNTNINVAFTNANLIDEKGDLFVSNTLFDIVNFRDKAKEYFRKGYGFELFNIANRATGATMAMRREFVFNNLPIRTFNSIYHDEYFTWYGINQNCLGFIDECLMNYRIHANQQIGIEKCLQDPNDNNIFKCRIIKEPLTEYDDFSSFIKSKINFNNKRLLNIKSHYGLFRILFSFKQYIKLYRKCFFIFMISDIIDFISLNIKRLKRKLKFV